MHRSAPPQPLPCHASVLAFLWLLAAGCAERPASAPAAPSASVVPCTNAWVAHDLDEESIGVSIRPPIRRAPPGFEDADADAVRLFHDVLAPYGPWEEDSRLGLVWTPSRAAVGTAFVPYATHGRWTHREIGSRVPFHEYVWVSELPWGWATFHYGRWAFAGERGWVWVAGRKYAGAWVDWRLPGSSGPPQEEREGVVAWGPTPPVHVWRVVAGQEAASFRDTRLVAVPYTGYAMPFVYAHARDLFDESVGGKLLAEAPALAVAYATAPSAPPAPERLGFRAEEVPAPPLMDRGLQRAWMLASPASATAVGVGPELGPPPRLRTWVAGGRRYAVAR